VIWTAIRVLLILAALAVLFSAAVFVQSSDGTTQVLIDGVVIDLIALTVLVASAWSLLRDRRRA
jgi:hypothetical protein